MRPFFHFSVFVLALSALFACGAFADVVKTESKALDAFEGVCIEARLNLNVTVGPEYTYQLEGPAEVLEFVELVIEQGTLKIRHTMEHPTHVFRDINVNVYVTTPKIDSICLRGMGDFTLVGKKGGSLHMELVGKGDMTARDIEVDKLTVVLTGNGDVLVTGKAGEVDLRIAGSGDIIAKELITDNAQVHVAGVGDISVYSSGSLMIRLLGRGDITYYGDPKTIEQKMLGNGKVSKGQ